MGIVRAALAAVLGAAACTGSPAPRSPLQPPGGDARVRDTWQSRLDVTHPLVGVIWDVASRRPIAEAELADRIGASEVVLVGETHDDADHHRLEARVVMAFAARHRAPAVVFEMLDRDRQAAVEEALTSHPGDADALSRAVDWDSSGWPAWSIYRPVFEAALDAKASLLAGGIDRRVAMRIATRGPAAYDPRLDQAFDLHDPPPGDEQAALRREMSESHCGLVPGEMLDAMALVQRTRDALLAERLHEGAARGHGALLVAGDGHVRRDRGVPALLARVYGARSLAIALLEVRPDGTSPDAYAHEFDAAGLPFDVVWFTPRASDADRCAELRRHLGAHAHAAPGDAGPPARAGDGGKDGE